MAGGVRKGAGRKKGAVSIKSQEVVRKAIAEGVTPIEVMLTLMREAWDAIPRNDDKAMEYAIAAAPYVHPKIAPVDAKTGETAKFVIIDPCS